MTTALTQRSEKLRALQDLFSATHDTEDLLAILEEADADLDLAISRIAEGVSYIYVVYLCVLSGCISGVYI